MGNVFTLDSLREEVEKQYAPVVVGLSDGSEVTLSNLLRLNRKSRDKVLSLLKDVELAGSSDEDEDGSSDNLDKLIGAASELLLQVADPAGGKKLIAELDGDLTLTMKLLERWMETTSVGEAPRSQP